MDNYNKKIKEYLNLYNEGVFGDTFSNLKARAGNALKNAGEHIGRGIANTVKNVARVGAHVAAGAVGIPLPNKGFMKLQPLDHKPYQDNNKVYLNLQTIVGRYKNILDLLPKGIQPDQSSHSNFEPTIKGTSTKLPSNNDLLTTTKLPGSRDGVNSVYFIDLFNQMDNYLQEHLRRRQNRSRKISEYKPSVDINEFLKWLGDKARQAKG